MGNLIKFIKTLALFGALAVGLAAVRWLLNTTVILQNLGPEMGRWSWPILLLLGTFLGYRILKVSRDPVVAPVRAIGGVLFVLALFLIRAILSGRALAIPTPSLLMLPVLTEEMFFRWIGLESLRVIEEPLHRDPYLKRLAPLSLLSMTLIFGVVEGLTPIGRSGSGDGNLGVFTVLNYLYLLTGSIWPTAIAHLLY